MHPGSPQQKRIMQRPESQRQIRLQIYLPLFFGSMLIVGLVVVLLFEDRSYSLLADIALICIALPILLLGLLTMAILVLGVFATEKVIQKLPKPFRKVHQVMSRFERTAKQLGETAAKPMISSLSAWAGVKTFFQSVASIFRSDEGNSYE